MLENVLFALHQCLYVNLFGISFPHNKLVFFYISDDIEIEPLLEPSSGTDGDSEPVYGNVGLCTIVPVKVEDLWDYVKANKINEAEGLKREYRVSGLICVHQ